MNPETRGHAASKDVEASTDSSSSASSDVGNTAAPLLQPGVVLVIIDGIADVGIPVLNNKTPLQIACLPFMDRMAQNGVRGLMDPVAPGIACGSDTAHMSMFGFEPRGTYRGRGALEAEGDRMTLPDGSIAFKCNFATLNETERIVTSRKVADFEDEARALCAELNGISIPGHEDVNVEIRHAMHHRCAIVLSGPKLSDNIVSTDPLEDDKPLDEPRPSVEFEDCELASFSANVLSALSAELIRVLRDHPINVDRREKNKPTADVVLLRGASSKVTMRRTFQDKHRLKAFLIAPTKIIAGVGLMCGIPVIDVDGATGDYRTNYAAKARKCVELMTLKAENGSYEYDMGIVHIKSVDDAGHKGHLIKKIEHLERVDDMLEDIVEKLTELRPDTKIALTGDHTTSVSFKDHTCEPVPFVMTRTDLLKAGAPPSEYFAPKVLFDEVNIGSATSLGRFPGMQMVHIIRRSM